MIFGLLVAGAIALATLRRYSLIHTATFTSLAFFLSSGLTSVTAAPSYGHRSSIISEAMDMEPWVQPCGTPVAAPLRKLPQRHSVHRALKRVRTQLRVAQEHLRKDIKDIHEIYSKVYKVLKEQQYRMSWLPEKQLDWYHRELWCLEKSKKAEKALPRLHDALQRFAITFYHLRAFRLKSNINAELTMSRRNEIIDGMYNEVRRTLCEVETAIFNLGLQLPTTHKANIVTESSNWAEEGDLTLMLIQDSGVLRLYRDFLNDWTRAFRNATAIGPGTCDPSMIKPLIYKSKKPKKEFQHKKKQKNPMKKQNGQIKKNIAFNRNRQLFQGMRWGMRRRLGSNKPKNET
ncbi:uncharacterized protein LOC122499972 isoform X1 [Leptopilina heterotoma]|uniref:uncharacterized protein LOC122499972 isoform X1 n=1 Tax=Leptopilina heterotoma TaxID=63436 RepID=UPI001CA9F431|nr:uncharacterized protein LOC122499972 isoform X1 [Leptopilina heterotoma]